MTEAVTRRFSGLGDIPRVPSTVWAGERASSVAEQGLEVVELAGGPMGPLPPHVVEAGQKAVVDDSRAPSRGSGSLRSVIARKLETENGLSIDPASGIVVSNGAIHALDCVLRAYVDPGDQVAMFGPGFFIHNSIVLAGGDPLIVPCREEDGFRPDLDRLEHEMTERTKVLLIINPINPTGVVLSEGELSRIADIARSHDLLVIADEAYEKFMYDGKTHMSLGALPNMADRTLTVHSLTKCYGLRSSRVGYVAGSSDLVAPVLKVLEWSALTCNPVSQAMAEAAISGPQDWLLEAYGKLAGNRRRVRDALEKSDYLSSVLPEGATFFFVNVEATGVSSEVFCDHLLVHHGVPTVPGTAFAGGHMIPDRYFRLPFGGSEHSIEKATTALDLASRSVSALGGTLVQDQSHTGS